MESLEINNFLTIKNAKVEIKRLTILIGPQANGKSIIAKLVYFFRKILTTRFIKSIEGLETQKQLESSCLTYFEQIFPAYSWAEQDFTLTYSNSVYFIVIDRKKLKGKRGGLKITFSPGFISIYRKIKASYKRIRDEEEQDPENMEDNRSRKFRGLIEQQLYNNSRLLQLFQRSIFIPASRSFFANLQKNVFTFLANNIAIDPLIKEFGSEYEVSKNVYTRGSFGKRYADEIGILDELTQEVESILAGRYSYVDEQDWIIRKNGKINLANASSGQQESLPMLLVLLAWAKRSAAVSPLVRLRNRSTFFIEEPEAHLFPISQKSLVRILSKLYNRYSCNFLLTTHSPYILTALNNLIMASNLVVEDKPDILNQVEAIVGKNNLIVFEDIAAYTIKDGLLENILTPELKLIGSSVIDSVSDEFDREFDKLMELELS